LKIDNLEIAYIIVMLESFLKLKCEVEEWQNDEHLRNIY
jgi:hypothetical protein